jgi:hypothetical protein
MAAKIRPGNFNKFNKTDYGPFANSMAEAIDNALQTLMHDDGLPDLKMDPNDPEVRDRRRLFVAIARGVVAHLDAQSAAMRITLPDSTVVWPNLDVDMT